MADTKISDLTAITEANLANDDEFAVVDTSAVETKRITVAEMDARYVQTANATHTGEVTGSTALTVDKTAISGKSLVTAAAGDHILVGDASDSDNLKKVTAQTIADLAPAGDFNPQTHAVQYNDYFILLDVGFTWNSSGSGSTVAINSGYPSKDRPGQIVLGTGTTTTGRAYSYASEQYTFGNGFTYATALTFNILSTVGEEYTAYAGIVNGFSGTGSHGVYFMYDRLNQGANWQAVVDDDSGTTTTDTGVAVTAGAYQDLKIVMNDAYDSCVFTIDGSDVATITTNFPDSGTDQAYAQVRVEKSAGTTSRNMYSDFMYIKYTVART